MDVRSKDGTGFLVVATEADGSKRVCGLPGAVVIFAKRQSARDAAKAERRSDDQDVEVIPVDWSLLERVAAR